MKNFTYLFLAAALFAAVSCGKALPENFTLAEGQELMPRESYGDFDLKARVLADEGSVASLFFHSDGESGYEVALRNGEIDGTCKTGSLLVDSIIPILLLMVEPAVAKQVVRELI